MDIFSKFNWIDIVAVIIIFRMGYVGSLFGIGKMILPVIFQLCIVLITLLLYGNIALVLFRFTNGPINVLKFISFSILLIIAGFVFGFFTKLILFNKPDMMLPIERAGGFFLGLLKGLMFAGLFFVWFALLPIKGTDQAVENSYIASSVVKRNVELYTATIQHLNRLGFVKTDESEYYNRDAEISEIFGRRQWEIDLKGIDIENRREKYQKQKGRY